MSAPAVDRLFRIKRRSRGQPILVILGDRTQVSEVIDRLPQLGRRLMDRFWPGPLTLVLPAKSTVPPALTAHTGRLGVRIPGLPLPRLLATAAGGPITATSANRSGAPAATTAQMVEAIMGKEIELILDGGPTAGGRPSTLLDLCEQPPALIRKGRIPVEQIRAICGDVGPSRAS